MKKAIIGVLVLAFLGSFTVMESGINSSYGNLMTGSFTEADKSLSEKEDIYIEQVYWKFDNGRNATGRITRQNFSPGVHNVTVVVKKSNGETETYRKQLKVDR